MTERRKNLVFILIVLLLAGGSWLFFHAKAGKSADAAVLEYGDTSLKVEYPLYKNARYDVDTGYYTVHLEVKDGKIRFVDSPCPDHTCESFGWLSKPGDWAACLPARAKLSVAAGE